LKIPEKIDIRGHWGVENSWNWVLETRGCFPLSAQILARQPHPEIPSGGGLASILTNFT
jgi:predicted transposase YbfD/YdcC